MADADADAKPLDQNALVADIDRTRAELARTIDAISERVSPKKNVDRVLEQARQRATWLAVARNAAVAFRKRRTGFRTAHGIVTAARRTP